MVVNIALWWKVLSIQILNDIWYGLWPDVQTFMEFEKDEDLSKRIRNDPTLLEITEDFDE